MKLLYNDNIINDYDSIKINNNLQNVLTEHKSQGNSKMQGTGFHLSRVLETNRQKCNCCL